MTNLEEQLDTILQSVQGYVDDEDVLAEVRLPAVEKLKSLITEARLDELATIPIRDEENEWDAVDIVDEVQQHVFIRSEELTAHLTNQERKDNEN